MFEKKEEQYSYTPGANKFSGIFDKDDYEIIYKELVLGKGLSNYQIAKEFVKAGFEKWLREKSVKK